MTQKPVKSHGDWIFPVVVLAVLLGFLGFLATSKTPASLDNGATLISVEPPYSFEEVFAEIRRIDARFHTDFRNETLNGKILRTGAAKEYLKLLTSLRATVENKTEPEHTKYIEALITAREEMMHSEIEFQKAISYGKQGIFQSPSSCYFEKEIREATAHYNLSREHGGKAILNLDRALTYVPGQGLIGVNENKPQFYSHVLQEIGQLVETNSDALRKLCAPSQNGTLIRGTN